MNNFLENSFPDILTNVEMIFQKRDKAKKIRLFSVLSNVLERLIHNQLNEFKEKLQE